ncbi:CheR family methyltransferase [Alteripontixanthobacter muriae]|uniref:CheR family methyltransferase n=1 Tax=Alteripontixanthobacter muriae TaxID=2705546 RepID=UPI001E5A5978|nr:CheR family methyltransferase [Alteripontixanthobacter muriae]
MAESRRWRIDSALAGLYRRLGIANADQLVCMLAVDGQDALADEVVEALLNNETYFFRDRNLFTTLATEFLPALAARRASTKRLSIWSAGCSTGQEVLTLAMLFAADRQWDDWKIEILGTDVSAGAICTARLGRYSQFEIQRGLGVVEMIGYFDETDSGWQSRNRFAADIRFEQHNLLDAAPRSEAFDLVLCRNLLLYFDAATRAAAFARLRSALADDGLLMLGAGETPIGQTDLFSAIAGANGMACPLKTAGRAESSHRLVSAG